jgi:hypothetical protein
VRSLGVQIGLQDATDKKLGERPTVEVVEEPTNWINQGRPKGLWSAETIKDVVATLGQVECFGQELSVVVNEDALFSKCFGKRVVFFLRSRGPHHIVKEQSLNIVRREPRKFEARSMDDGLTELANF